MRRGGALPPSRALRLPPVGATLRLLLDRSSVVQSTGILTSWRDRASGAHHGTPNGSPVVSGAGVVFDGANDYVSGGLAIASDAILTIFTVTVGAANGVLVEVSDTGATLRSAQVLSASGNRASRQGAITEVGDAYYVFASSAMTAHTHEFTHGFRTVWENGRWRASSGYPLATTRAPAYYRVGAALNGGQLYAGTIAAIAIYEGPLTEAERKAIERVCRHYARAAEAYSWPAYSASSLVGDPRIIVPPVVYGINDRPISIWRDTVHYRDGQAPQTLSGSLAVDSSYRDRWIVTPATTGAHPMTLTEGAYEVDFNIVSRAALGGGDAAKNILLVGDSNTARGVSGWIQFLGDALGAHAAFVGRQTPPSGYSYKHEGHDGFLWADLAGASGPFWHSGAVDIPWYLTQLDDPPDVIVWSAFNHTDWVGDHTAALATAMGLKDAFDDELPDALHVYVTPWPGAGLPAIWSDEPQRNAFRADIMDAVLWMHEELGGREAERIHVLTTTSQIDSVDGYVDTVHMNSAPGHVQHAEAMLCGLTGIVWP